MNKRPKTLAALGSTDVLGADDSTWLLARRRALIDQRAQANFEIAEVDRRLQQLCKHDWKWEQVAGEGKTCTKCGARDYSED